MAHKEERFAPIGSDADVNLPIATPMSAETRSAHPAPTREQIYAATGRAGAAAEASDSPEDGEQRRSLHISRPWAILWEFRPRNVTCPEPYRRHLPHPGVIDHNSRLENAITGKPPTPVPSISHRGTKVVRFDPGSGVASRWGAALVAAVVGSKDDAPIKTPPLSSDRGALALQRRLLHEVAHDAAPAPPGAMSLCMVLRRPGYHKVGRSVRRGTAESGSHVPRRQARSFPSTSIRYGGQCHRVQLARHKPRQPSGQTKVAVGGRRELQAGEGARRGRIVPDVSRIIGVSRFLGFSTVRLQGTSLSSMSSKPTGMTYRATCTTSATHRRQRATGIRGVPQQPEGGEQFDTSKFLLRVDKNCYGTADAGIILQ